MARTVHIFARPIVRHANPLMKHAAAKLVGWDLTVVQVYAFILSLNILPITNVNSIYLLTGYEGDSKFMVSRDVNYDPTRSGGSQITSRETVNLLSPE